MSDPFVLEARIEQAACAERIADPYTDDFISEDFRDGIERASCIAVKMLAPRTITTVEELFDLAHGTVILQGGEAYRVFRWATDPGRLDLMEFGNEMSDVVYFGKQESGYLPATVLYTPEEA